MKREVFYFVHTSYVENAHQEREKHSKGKRNQFIIYTEHECTYMYN